MAPRGFPGVSALEVTVAAADPRKPVDIHPLTRGMNVANPPAGAPRIHGELLKLGVEVGQPQSQDGWKTFLRIHADAVVSIDIFVVPTISFRLLDFWCCRISRREILWPDATVHPSAEWIARQSTEASGCREPPQLIIRVADGADRGALIRRLGAMDI